MKIIMFVLAMAILGTGPAVAQTVNQPCVKTQYGHYCKIGEYQVKYEKSGNPVQPDGTITVAGPESMVSISDGGVTVEYGHYILAR